MIIFSDIGATGLGLIASIREDFSERTNHLWGAVMLLDVRGVYKSYDGLVNVVEDVSFSIPEGSICGFLGPNGAGKTTTMRICSTLELPDAGDVFVDGFMFA